MLNNWLLSKLNTIKLRRLQLGYQLDIETLAMRQESEFLNDLHGGMWFLDEATLCLLVLLRIPADWDVLRFQIVMRRRRLRCGLKARLLPTLAEEVQSHIVNGYIDAIGTHALGVDEHAAHQDGIGALEGSEEQERNDMCQPEAQQLVIWRI